jgi:hypothetical protein
MIVFGLLCKSCCISWSAHINIQFCDSNIEAKVGKSLEVLLKSCWNGSEVEMGLESNAVKWNTYNAMRLWLMVGTGGG